VQKRIIIRNGKKYRVNCVGWEDGIWMPSSGTSLTAGFNYSTISDGTFITASFTNTTVYTGTGSLIYNFNFGDGSPVTGSANVVHYYASGSYIPKLSVTESLGNLSSSYSTPIICDPYNNVLVFSGSYLAIKNPTGTVSQTNSNWKKIIGHNCVNLTTLLCNNNQLTSLNLSGSIALQTLDCSSNTLSSLNVSGSTALTYLDCNSNNSFTSLDLSTNIGLVHLYCFINQLSSLNVSGSTALQILNCGYNILTSLDVSTNTGLTELQCGTNPLTSLDTSANTALQILYCGYSQLTSLDVSTNIALQTLDCSGNFIITSLNLNGALSLTHLYCNNNSLTSLVLPSYLTTYVDCSFNYFTTLEFLKDTESLTTLICAGNQLTELHIGGQTFLTYLDANHNNMNQSEVDIVLFALDINGQLDGYCDLVDGNSPPGPAGLTSKANLEAKGWSVGVS